MRGSCGFSWKEEGQERKECGGQGRSSNRGRFLDFLDDFFWQKNKSQEQ